MSQATPAPLFPTHSFEADTEVANSVQDIHANRWRMSDDTRRRGLQGVAQARTALAAARAANMAGSETPEPVVLHPEQRSLQLAA